MHATAVGGARKNDVTRVVRVRCHNGKSDRIEAASGSATMVILKSGGATPTERLLAKLCEQTFLGFWSYPNTYRDQGGPKELCDLLVVSGNNIIIFSDKRCAFPDTGDLKLDWSRWYRKAILGSAQQIFGAERWLKNHPDRVFLDNKCAERLPLSLAHMSNCRFHRVIVALGAQQRCRRHLGGSGSPTLAAMFLSQFVRTGNWRELVDRARGGAVLDIQGGGWELVENSAWYQEAREFLKHSYVWDRIIQEFATHAFGGTLIEGSAGTVAANEEIFRCMAGEPRIPRAFLAAKMLERWSGWEKKRVDYRIVASPTFADTLYVFVFVPNAFETTDQYRKIRQDYLRDYCFLVHCNNRSFHRVIGIATNAGDQPYRTFEVVFLEGDPWIPEMEELVKEIALELDVSRKRTIHRITDQVPPGASGERAVADSTATRWRKARTE